MPGRFTYAFYVRMGMWDCVTFDVGEYVETAVALGLNETLRAEVSEKITASVGRIFNDQTALRAFEQEMIAAVSERRGGRK
jgi:predicted O-linked N-acetylglucosamine transferase (SPINDLY family)